MIEQIALAVTGTAAVWLTNDPREQYRKWAAVAGLSSEPFWFHGAWAADQYGVMVLCVIYTVGWSRGLYHSFFK